MEQARSKAMQSREAGGHGVAGGLRPPEAVNSRQSTVGSRQSTAGKTDHYVCVSVSVLINS